MSLFCQMFASKQSIDRTVKEIDEHYLLVDTSAQLTHRKFRKDLDAVVARSRDSGQTHVFCDVI
jgi:hypothetical protein